MERVGDGCFRALELHAVQVVNDGLQLKVQGSLQHDQLDPLPFAGSSAVDQRRQDLAAGALGYTAAALAFSRSESTAATRPSSWMPLIFRQSW